MRNFHRRRDRERPVGALWARPVSTSKTGPLFLLGFRPETGREPELRITSHGARQVLDASRTDRGADPHVGLLRLPIIRLSMIFARYVFASSSLALIPCVRGPARVSADDPVDPEHLLKDC